jgi:hypothetical protein
MFFPTFSTGLSRTLQRFKIIPGDDDCPFARLAPDKIDSEMSSGVGRRTKDPFIDKGDAAQRQDLTGLTRFAGSNSKAIELQNRLSEIAELPDGWNSYNAPAPNHIAITHARMVLESLIKFNFEPLGVIPSAEGGAGFVFKNNGRKGDIECLNSGSILAVYYSREVRPQSWIVDPGTEGIAEAINRIRTFLNA